MNVPGSGSNSSATRDLTPEQQELLSKLLDEYFTSLEQGRPLTRQELEARCPALAPLVGEYLASLEFLQGAAVGFRPALTADSEDASGSLVARRLGDYRILREIGRGGMGVVYEACQESLQRRVALKVLPFAALLDAQQIARFRNEAQAAAQLHHPHIVPVFGVGVEQGVHYYAMQYIDGQPLDRLIATRRRPGSSSSSTNEVAGQPPLPLNLAGRAVDNLEYIRAVADLTIQAAEALQAAHEAGVVHRDIKPSNLLLTADGRLWVTDFGLARCRGDAELTRPGDFVGTIRYMSPEQARGPAHLIDPRTDVYSLGVTSYELLTLHPALRGQSPPELLHQLEHGNPYPPRTWNPAIPFDLETILLKAIAKSRDERYGSAREFADDLRRFLEGRPVVARRPTLLDRSAKWARRHQLSVAGGIGAAVLAMAALLVNTAIVTQQRQRAEHALKAARESFQQYRDQLALSNNHLAMLHEQQGDLVQAEKYYRESIRLQREALREHPGNSATLRTLAATLGNLAGLRGPADAAEAEALFDESVELQRALAAAAPQDRSRAADLALTHSNRGSLRSRQGRLSEAVESFRAAIVILQRLHDDGPGDKDAARDLAVSLNNLGMALHRLDNLSESERSFRAAAAALPMDTEDDPRRPADCSSRGGIYNNLGLVLQRQQRPVEALEAFDQAIAWQEAACRAAPRVERFRQLLSQHRENREKLDNSPDVEEPTKVD